MDSRFLDYGIVQGLNIEASRQGDVSMREEGGRRAAGKAIGICPTTSVSKMVMVGARGV